MTEHGPIQILVTERMYRLLIRASMTKRQYRRWRGRQKALWRKVPRGEA